MPPEPATVFVVQVVWFTLAFALVARLVVWPWSRTLKRNRAIAVWVAPQMSRILGWGLMVPQLAPGMPAEFYRPTVIGDTATALLAMGAFVALMRDHRWALVLAWACMIVGIADGTHALMTAARLQVAGNLAAQWFVPAVNVPLMAVCHVAGVVALLRARGVAP